MIKNVIYVLMIIICCLYGQNIPCKFGQVVGGVCKCDSIYTEKCPMGESFSISTEKEGSGSTRVLESEEEKVLESVMELKVANKRLLAVSGIKVADTPEDVTVGRYDIQNVTFNGDLGFDKAGGVIRCKKDPNAILTLLVYGKSSTPNTYYVENGLVQNDECFVISKSNDFSLLLLNVNIQSVTFVKKSDSDKYTSTVTIDNLGTIFSDIGIPLNGNIAFKTSKADYENVIYTATYTSELVATTVPDPRLLNDNSSRILAGDEKPNLQLTITTATSLTSVTITPYLLMNSKGDKLSLENSEIGNYINKIGKDYKLTKAVEKQTIGTGDNAITVYEVSDVVYEGIGINGGKLSCIDIYGNKFNGNIYSYNLETNKYYIEYDNDVSVKNKVLFSCEITSFENDFSLLLKNVESETCSGSSPYTCIINNIGTLFTSMGIDVDDVERGIAFRIGNNDNTIYTGKFKFSFVATPPRLLDDNSSRILAGDEKPNLQLTITTDENIGNGVTITPYLLMNSKGDKLSLENSEIGYYVNKVDENLKLTKAETVSGVTSVNIYEVSDVVYEGIDKNGGKLSCIDVYGNKFNGNIYSFNADKYYIEYDNDVSVKEKRLYTCEVISTENDISLLLRNVKVTGPETCTPVAGSPPPYECEITITGLGTLFTSMGIDVDDVTRGIAFRKILTPNDNDNTIYTGIFKFTYENNPRRILNDNSSRILADEDLKLTITSTTDLTSATMTPYLLMKADKSKVSIQNSELNENIYCDSENKCILIKGEEGDSGVGNSIIMKDGKMEIILNDIVENSESFEVAVYGEAKVLFHKYFREGLSLINSETGDSVKIIEVKEGKYSNPRLLSENRRNLVDSTPYTIKTSPSISTIVPQGAASTSFQSSYSYYHPQIECSGQGNCNRISGECECYEGYSGANCERMGCMNGCSEHGECELVKTMLGVDSYSESVYGCKCNPGYRGSDCSLVECPSGSDPEGGSSENRDCSGRGVCNYNNGECSCFSGYGGDGGDCSKKWNFI